MENNNSDKTKQNKKRETKKSKQLPEPRHDVHVIILWDQDFRVTVIDFYYSGRKRKIPRTYGQSELKEGNVSCHIS